MGMGEERGRAIEAARPFASVADLQAQAPVPQEALEVLSEVGAFASLGLGRREALWQASVVAREGVGLFAGVAPADGPSPLAEMTPEEETRADYLGSGMTVGPHRMAHLRAELARQGICSAAELGRRRDGEWAKVAGMVIVRQRPGTAKGFVFLTLEDETGLANAILVPQVFEANRALIVSSPLLVVEGRLQVKDGVVHVRAAKLTPITGLRIPGASHDFC